MKSQRTDARSSSSIAQMAPVRIMRSVGLALAASILMGGCTTHSTSASDQPNGNEGMTTTGSEPVPAREALNDAVVIECLDPDTHTGFSVRRASNGLALHLPTRAPLEIRACQRARVELANAYATKEVFLFRTEPEGLLELTVEASRGVPPHVSGASWVGPGGATDTDRCLGEPDGAWLSEHGCEELPPRQDTEPAEFPRVTRTLQLKEVSAAGGDVRFRFVDDVGGEIVFYDWRMNGKPIDLEDNAFFAAYRSEDSIFAQYRLKPGVAGKTLTVTYEERYGDRLGTGEKIEYGVIVQVR